MEGLLTGDGDQPVGLARVGSQILPVKALWRPDLPELKKMFTRAREGASEGRKRARTNFDYYHDKQWTRDEIQRLKDRGQPIIWNNRIKPTVRGILGVLEQGQTDPRAFPRNNTDTDASEVATDALRYAAERARWQRTKLKSAKDYLIGGIGAVIIEVDEDRDPKPTRIRYREFFYDPHSQEADFSDARYMGVAKWMDADLVRSTFRLVEAIDVGALSGSGGTSLMDDEGDEDRPAVTWGDKTRKRVLVVEMYLNEGGWKHAVFYGGGLLRYGESGYLDERGRPDNPIIAVSCEVDEENQRDGYVRTMIPMQDEVNMSRSKGLHMMNHRQVRQTVPGAQVSADDVRKEAARPDGIFAYGWDPVPTNDISAGQIARMNEAKAELERMGPNPAVLGRENAGESGRARLVRQQAGMVELTPVLGEIEDFDLRVYRAVWCRIRQFWNDPKMIRVTDNVGAPKFLMMNEIVGVQPTLGPDGFTVVEQPVFRNRPAEMDMDIILDTAPDTANLQAEQFDQLSKLAAVYGAQEVPFDDMLEASSLPRKRELLEKREARRKDLAQGQGPQQQLALAAAQADVENKQAQTEDRRAAALLKIAQTAETRARGVNALLQPPAAPPPAPFADGPTP